MAQSVAAHLPSMQQALGSLEPARTVCQCVGVYVCVDCMYVSVEHGYPIFFIHQCTQKMLFLYHGIG